MLAGRKVPSMVKPGASADRFGKVSVLVGTILSIMVIGWPVPRTIALTMPASMNVW
jgi:hypothetical protein